MSDSMDKKGLRKVRATWLAEKMDINYAKANAIVNKVRSTTRAEKVEIHSILKKEARAPLYLKTNKQLAGKKAWYKK